MSQSMNRAGTRFGTIDRARNPRISGFGKKSRELGDDEAGEAINPWANFEGEEYAPDYEAMARDLGVSQIRIDGKPVVRTRRPLKIDKPLVVYSNDPTKTTLTVDFGLSLQSLEDLGFDHLSIVLAACRAAKELGLTPREMGAKRLFREAAELQGKLTEQRAEAARKAAQLAKPTLALPTRTRGTTPQIATSPTPKAEKPEGADWLGRINRDGKLLLRCTCGCGSWMLETVAKVPGWSYMQETLGHRAEIWDLWQFVRTPNHARGGFSFTETVEASLEKERELKANNTLLGIIGVEGPSHRLSHFVVPVREGKGGEIAKLMGKRDMRPSDWDQLHSLLGTDSPNALREAQAKRIAKWDVGDQKDVIDLRVFTIHFHARQQRLVDQRAWSIRQAYRERTSPRD